MKNITKILFICCLIFAACNTQPDSKAIRKEVLNIHDKLMADGEKVFKNKMKLDTILAAGKLVSPEDTAHVTEAIKELNKADEAMMDWMHAFKDDFEGKTEQESIEYYKKQMIKIRAVEDHYLKIIRESDSLLNLYKIKPIANTELNNHKH